MPSRAPGQLARTTFGRWRGTIGAQVLGKQYDALGDEVLTPAANSNSLGAFLGADIETDAYTVLNLSTGVNVIVGGRVHTLTLRVDILGDTKYDDATSRIKEFSPNPGRNVALVYKVLF